MYQPKTGKTCHCRPGIGRDNCPDCEGTGQQIDFAKIRATTTPKPTPTPLAIGLQSDNERTQIITKDGWHLCYIEYDPHREIADEIVRAVNAYEPMREALLEARADLLLQARKAPPCIDKIAAALALAQKE